MRYLIALILSVTIVLIGTIETVKLQKQHDAQFKTPKMQVQVDMPTPSNADKGAYTQKTTFTTEGKILDVDFKSEILSLPFYSELLEEIKNLTAKDKLILHLSNFGGDAYTGIALFNAITGTPAKVHATVEAPSFSMGAMLPCSADTVELQPFSFLMYHDYSGVIGGKSSEMKGQLGGFEKPIVKMLKECTKHGILTDKNITDIMSGIDVYKHPEDIKK